MHGWDQSHFDNTLKDYLLQHESVTWPSLINKKAFFVAKRAEELTARTPNAKIDLELSKEVTAWRKDGTVGVVQIGYIMAAKLAAKTWTSSKRFQRAVQAQARGRGRNELLAWRAEIKAQLGKLKGSRKSATGFIRLGWLDTMRTLGPLTKLSFWPGVGLAAKGHGRKKGMVEPATPGKLSVKLENFAHTGTEKKGGFERIGEPALQLAIDMEDASMVEHMRGEMEPGINDFNRKQH